MSEETAVDVLNIKCCLEVRRRQSGHYFGILCVIERERRTLRDKGRNTQRVITGVEEDKKERETFIIKAKGSSLEPLLNLRGSMDKLFHAARTGGSGGGGKRGL